MEKSYAGQIDFRNIKTRKWYRIFKQSKENINPTVCFLEPLYNYSRIVIESIIYEFNITFI